VPIRKSPQPGEITIAIYFPPRKIHHHFQKCTSSLSPFFVLYISFGRFCNITISGHFYVQSRIQDDVIAIGTYYEALALKSVQSQ
jgi:hypothetical protein